MKLDTLQKQHDKLNAACALHSLKTAESHFNLSKIALEKSRFSLVDFHLTHFNNLEKKLSLIVLPEDKISRKKTEFQLRLIEAEVLDREVSLLENEIEYKTHKDRLDLHVEMLNRQSTVCKLLSINEEKEQIAQKIEREKRAAAKSEVWFNNKCVIEFYDRYTHSADDNDDYLSLVDRTAFSHPCQNPVLPLPTADNHEVIEFYDRYTRSADDNDDYLSLVDRTAFSHPCQNPAYPLITNKDGSGLIELEASTDTHFIGENADNDQIEGGRSLVKDYLEGNGHYLIIYMSQALFGEHFSDLAKSNHVQIHFGKINADVALKEGKRVLFVVDDTSDKTTDDTIIHVNKPEEIKDIRAQITKRLKTKKRKGTFIVYVKEDWFKRRFNSFQGLDGVKVFRGDTLPPDYECASVQFIVSPTTKPTGTDEKTETTSTDIVKTFEEYQKGGPSAASSKGLLLKNVAINLLSAAFSFDKQVLIENVITAELAYDNEKAIIAILTQNKELARPIVVHFITIYPLMGDFETDRVDYILVRAAKSKIQTTLYPLSEINYADINNR